MPKNLKARVPNYTRKTDKSYPTEEYIKNSEGYGSHFIDFEIESRNFIIELSSP